MQELLQPVVVAAQHSIIQNLGYIEAGFGLLIYSAIHTMPPEPPKGLKWIGTENWTWLRDTLQTAIPVRQSPSHPIPPVAPATKEKL